METETPIFIAGHRGLVGSAVLRKLQHDGFTRLLTRTRPELDLTNSKAVDNFFVREKAVENVLVDPLIKILAEPADGLCRAENSATDAAFIEFHQGSVPFLNFDNTILNWHWRGLYRGS